MGLNAGTKLGPYEIQSRLGAGGMGEVYRARDTRLNRTVAGKVPPSHLSQKAEARESFEREARAISALNHLYICHLYDIGEQERSIFLYSKTGLVRGTRQCNACAVFVLEPCDS